MEKTPETPDEAAEASTETLEDAPVDASLDPGAETPPVKTKEKPKKVALTPEMKADPISRKLIQLSLLFTVLAIACVASLAYLHHQKSKAHPAAVVEEPTKHAAQAITQALDEIQVVLKNEQELRVEMVVECSQIEACNYIKEHVPETRDLLIPLLNNLNPNELSSAESKNLIRKKLADRLNTLEMVGKVIQVEFVNLVVEGDPK